MYIPYNSLIIPLRILAKYTIPVIIFFSNIEIDLYSFYRKNFIVTSKICEKLVGHHTRLGESDNFSRWLSCIEKSRHFVYVHALIMRKSLHSEDVQCNTGQ